MLAGSIAFVALGKALVFELLGLHQQWWRYFRLPDLWPLVRALAVASAADGRSSSRSPSRSTTACRARSCLRLPALARPRSAAPGSRGRSLAERPARRRARARARARCSSSAPARAARWSSASCSSTRTSAPARSASSTTTRASAGCAPQGLKVLGTTDEIGAILDRTRARRGRHRDPLGARASCAARSSPPAASATSRCARCRPCSSCCAAASSSPASCARSRSRTCSAATRW